VGRASDAHRLCVLWDNIVANVDPAKMPSAEYVPIQSLRTHNSQLVEFLLTRTTAHGRAMTDIIVIWQVQAAAVWLICQRGW